MEEERNLSIDLMNPEEMLSSDVINSNEVYSDGYIPYFARRRMDLHEGEGFELVNDITVEFEFARLNQYGNRMCTDKHHLHDLIEYMVKKDTLFVPWIIQPGKEVITSGEEYRHANMAWEILKKYIHTIICKKVHYFTKGAKEPAQVMKNINYFINKKDLMAFITTAFKLGYDRTVAEIFGTIIWGFEYKRGNASIQDNSDIKRYFSEAILKRMVVFSLVGSRRDDYPEYINRAIHLRFPVIILRIASSFNPLEAGMIDIGYIETKYLYEFAYKIMKNGYDISYTEFGHFRFQTRESFISFYNTALKFVKEPDGEFKFQMLLMNTDHFIQGTPIIPDYKEIKCLIPNDDTKGPDEIYKAKCNSKICFMNYGTWLFANPDYINLNNVRPEWINEKNRHFTEALSYAILKKLKQFSPHKVLPVCIGSAITRVVRQTIYPFLKIIDLRLKEAKAVRPAESNESLLSKIPEMQFISYALQNPMSGFYIVVWIYPLLLKFSDLRTYIMDLISIYIHKSDDSAAYLTLTGEELDRLLELGVPLETVMRCINVYEDIYWIKENYGKLFVELPDYIFITNKSKHYVKGETICPPSEYSHIAASVPKPFGRKELEWIMSVLTEEQQRAYPFPIEIMRQNRDIFEPLIDRVNIDRYIAAYGLNWVEKHIEISISDIVNANAYVNEQVIRRYIDIILLDDELRKKMLMNKQVCKIIARYNDHLGLYRKRHQDGGPILYDILRSDNFSNEIKCEVLLHLKRVGIPIKLLVADIEQYLVGSGYVGRALMGMINVNSALKGAQEIVFSDIYDIQLEKRNKDSTTVEDKLDRIEKA